MTAPLLIPWFRWEAIAVPMGERVLTIFPYQITVALAILVIICTAALFASRRGRSVEQTLDFVLHVMVFALPGAVLAHVIVYQPQGFARFMEDPSRFQDLGLHWSTLGGMIGGLVGAVLWRCRRKESLLEILDTLAFALPFGWCIARIGCFGAHDHPGRVSDFALAVADFRFGAPPYQARHDMGLYDAILVGTIAIFFAVLSRSKREPGFYVGLLLVLYTPFRFLLDFLRAPEVEGGMMRHLGLTHVQYISLVLFVVGLLVIRRVRVSALK